MSRPWYAYLLLPAGVLALLLALFRPMVGVTSTSPGGFVVGRDHRLGIRPGGPLSQAGLQHGDYLETAETLTVAEPGPDRISWVEWKNGIPRSGKVVYRRGDRTHETEVRPAPPAPGVRFLWWLLGLMNVGLSLLALLLIWQRPRDGSAVLLALVLMTAPVFSFPREPRLLAVVLAAHFFSVFPPVPGERSGRRARWGRAALLYLPFCILGFFGTAVWDGGNPGAGRAIFDLLALAYSGVGVYSVWRRGRQARTSDPRVFRTLLLASLAILLATFLGTTQRLWLVGDQFIPANLLPAALFSLAVSRLVFRLRAMEVRLVARRTLQYLLARWTLGTLFLIPTFLLVWRLGQASVSGGARAADLLGYLVWMGIAAFLHRRRHVVLRNLDRRFFRDEEARRQDLVRLGQEIGEQSEEPAIWGVLREGVGRLFQPASLELQRGDGPSPAAELVVPIARAGRTHGILGLGRKADDQPYSQEERQLLAAVGVQTAAAVEAARLNAALLARQRAELAARSAGVLAGQEEERRRLAADLHDQVLPELRQIAGKVERLKPAANGVRPELEALEQELRVAMDSVREVMEALRPSALDMLGLADAVESHLRRTAAGADPPIAATLRRVGPEPALPPSESLALYRICQEAINNAVRHAGARKIAVELRATAEELTILVVDDGVGLDPDRPCGSGHGLSNIRYRADLVGAEVGWKAGETGGTAFRVRLPLARAAAVVSQTRAGGQGE